MAAALDVHIKDYGGREFGGEYRVGAITIFAGRLVVELEYSGTKSSKRLTTAWLEIDDAVVEQMLKVLSLTADYPWVSSIIWAADVVLQQDVSLEDNAGSLVCLPPTNVTHPETWPWSRYHVQPPKAS